MGRIYLVRHAATQWNLERRWQGIHDVPLSDAGREQLPGVERFFSGVALERIYVSDLDRARETAAAVATATGCEVEVRGALRERSFGEWEGHTNAELMEADPEMMATYQADRDGYCPPGGQPWNDFARHAVSTMESISAQHTDDVIAVVTHGGFLGAFINHVLRSDRGRVNRYSIHNASVSVVDRLDSDLVARQQQGDAALGKQNDDASDTSGEVLWRLEALNMTYHLTENGHV
jgi:2,3-bisphosphoglycerate-dependent phosphoglycerate mutase